MQVDAVVASPPTTRLAQQPDQLTGHATEQAGLASGTDHHTTSVDHDHADVADQGGSDHVGRVDGVTVDRFAASHHEPGTHRNIQRITRISLVGVVVVVDHDRGVGFGDAAAGLAGDGFFERRQVTHQVHERVGDRPPVTGDGSLEDREQCIGTTLGLAAGNHVRGRSIAVFGFGGVPVGLPFGLDEGVENLFHRGALDHTELGTQMKRVINPVQRRPPPPVGGLVILMRAIDIGERR